MSEAQCGMQRNGERAGTGRIESGSEQGDHVPTSMLLSDSEAEGERLRIAN